MSLRDADRIQAAFGPVRRLPRKQQVIINRGSILAFAFSLLGGLASIFAQSFIPLIIGASVFLIWAVGASIYIQKYGRRIDLSRTETSRPRWIRTIFQLVVMMAFVAIAISLLVNQ